MGEKASTKGSATSTARERSERHHRRHDPEAARDSLKALWPNPAIRRAAATLIANSIKVAHAEAPSSWELTLHPECVRLNVGQIAVLDLYERARGWTRRRAPEEQAFRIEVTFALDPVMRDTELATGIRLAKRAARRSP